MTCDVGRAVLVLGVHQFALVFLRWPLRPQNICQYTKEKAFYERAALLYLNIFVNTDNSP